jgi:hypothetical protein
MIILFFGNSLLNICIPQLIFIKIRLSFSVLKLKQFTQQPIITYIAAAQNKKQATNISYQFFELKQSNPILNIIFSLQHNIKSFPKEKPNKMKMSNYRLPFKFTNRQQYPKKTKSINITLT